MVNTCHVMSDLAPLGNAMFFSFASVYNLIVEILSHVFWKGKSTSGCATQRGLTCTSSSLYTLVSILFKPHHTPI